MNSIVAVRNHSDNRCAIGSTYYEAASSEIGVLPYTEIICKLSDVSNSLLTASFDTFGL
jgi:hypothetical protein